MLKYTVIVLFTITALVVAAPPAPSPAGSRAAALDSLASLLSGPTLAVKDTNGDGLADAVAARVIVPASPTTDDVEAAANIAARLAYETTAMSLPLVVRDEEVKDGAAIELPILVGRGNRFIKALIDRGDLDLKGLEAGQGIVRLARSPLGGPRGLVVVGADDAGTLAAGVELAARLPRLWNMTGVTLKAIEEQAAQYLESKGVGVSSAVIEALVVDAERRGISQVAIRAAVNGPDGRKALDVLAELDAAHRRGQEERTLNFAEAAATRFEIVAGGKVAGQASVRRSGMNARTLTPPVDPDEFLPDPSPERGGAPEPRLAPARPFDLSNTYTIDGWYGDAYADLIPDRTDTTLVVGDGPESLGAAHIAARLGLETTGISLPITRRDQKIKEPGNEPSPILVGRNNTLVQQLLKIGKVRFDDLEPGDGAVQLVPRAFGNATATVVAGADPAGTLAASQFLARRAPYLWDTQPGSWSLEDLGSEVSKFLGAKTGASQAALALRELRDVLDDVKDKTIESFDAKLYLEKGNADLDKYLNAQVTAAVGKSSKVTVSSQGITDPSPVFEEKIDIPWEVDEFWTRFRSDVLPKVKAGARVTVEARLSEPLEVRAGIVEQARTELKKAGAVEANVKVLCAYKQGFSWLTEDILPALKGKGARAIKVQVLAHKPDLTKKFKFYGVPTRWLHELYPVDEIFQRDLGVPTSSFKMELVDAAKETYVIDAYDGGGRSLLHASFSPKVVEREYLDKFPGWSRVEVTTGWLSASVDGQQAVDTRIQTDPERFWDYYQSKVLPRVYDNVMKVTGGKPTADKQPFHRDFDMEVWMSEPDSRIGVDEELVSSLEALHEDLYFVTLDFFGAMGRTLTRNRLNAPGKIFPIIHPSRNGKPGQARILYAGNASTKAKLDVTYKEKGVEKPTTVSKDLSRIDATAPTVVRAVVRADGVREFELQVEAKEDKEASRAVDALDGLGRLQAAGLYQTALSFAHVDRVVVGVLLKDARTRRAIVATGKSMPSNVRVAPATPPTPGDKAGLPRLALVTWDHIIGPDESEDIVAKLARSPEIHAYKVGESYRGRDISVMEATLPTPSELISRAKYTAYKPTMLVMGRQHANEVSSTSHILRLAELVATDPKYREILKKVNLVLCPVMNPDGAAMAFELQKLTPTYMLHAGRYSALGMDITSRAVGLLPEAEVEGRLWRAWLPDIYLNPHGYPSHEWVQPFSGYVAPGFRAYWSSRGWYTMVSGLRDPRYPAHGTATAALREAIVREINGNPDVHAMSTRHQARYRRWAYGFGPHVYGIEVYKDTMIYYSDPESGEPRGSRRASSAAPGASASSRRPAIAAWPQVTFMSGMTEAPDETAQGDWLSLVSKAGFSFLMAHVRYLEQGSYRLERVEESGVRDGAVITMLRPRPVMPGEGRRAAEPANGAGGGGKSRNPGN